ncbi:hypothetical protein [Ancrocorticia populi]|uniref:hypothetical protein n=1 Tax=Ancrocorticia populi TaxID=2175228 RepID=UPI003F973574
MSLPSPSEVDAEAIRLGIAIDGVCPPAARAQVMLSLSNRGDVVHETVEDLHVTIARLDRNLIEEGCENSRVRAAAIGAFVAAILTPNNTDTK